MYKLKLNPDLILKLLLALLLTYLVFLINANPADLPTADLGRHIMNGKIICSALATWDTALLHKILYSNFYSYTQPDFVFVNHHWLTGVFYYWIDKNFGLTILTFTNIFFILFANFFFFLSARLLSNTSFALFITMLSLPITCLRSEVRPESISYFFLALIIYLLVLYDKGKISYVRLLILATIVQVIWINFHIFFFLGIFVMFCYGLKYLINQDRERINKFLLLGLIVVSFSLINPHGLTGLLYPLNIFKGYGYATAENQSVIFMQLRNPNALNYYYYEILFFITLLLSFIYRRKLDPALVLIAFSLLILGFKTNRAMTLGAFAIIPFIASAVDLRQLNKHNLKILFLTLVSSCFLIAFYQFYAKKKVTDFIFDNNVNYSAQFFKRLDIQGPIFNNFDIGGYLIYHLFPNRRVFVDNRPEAYDESFMQGSYLAALKEEDTWQELDKRINFNAIFFYRHDMTEYGQPFLIRRIQDSNWAPVYVDDSNIILLKNNAINNDRIVKSRLPDSMFKVVNTK